MKFFISLIALISMISCSNNDAEENTVVKNVSVNGTWKPYKYEFKGKTYTLNDCEKKGSILINTNMSGVYERYDLSSSGNCNLLDSYSGTWTYNNQSGDLALQYNENGVGKTLQKKVETFSDTELRITDNTKNLDGVAGTDEAVLVYTK